jgi:hypothetical protein
LIRALCDFRPPFGLRELATRANVDAGYASRVVQTLVRDALVVRTARGPITSVDWSALLRRWAEDYSPLKQSRVSWYLAPRGLAPVIDTLKTLRGGYVVSGTWAANLYAPVAPARLLLCYADDVQKLAKTAGGTVVAEWCMRTRADQFTVVFGDRAPYWETYGHGGL